MRTAELIEEIKWPLMQLPDPGKTPIKNTCKYEMTDSKLISGNPLNQLFILKSECIQLLVNHLVAWPYFADERKFILITSCSR